MNNWVLAELLGDRVRYSWLVMSSCPVWGRAFGQPRWPLGGERLCCFGEIGLLLKPALGVRFVTQLTGEVGFKGPMMCLLDRRHAHRQFGETPGHCDRIGDRLTILGQVVHQAPVTRLGRRQTPAQ